MIISDNTKTLLLLLKTVTSNDVECLKPAEARSILDLLEKNNKNISNLLSDKKLLTLIESEKGIKESRLSKLLSNSMHLSISLSEWSKLGIWIISVLDFEHYPIELKMRYRDKCPLIIFGSGDKQSLNKPGVGVVGSRTTTPDESKYAELSGKKFASKDILLITGGARGIDQDSMHGSLENDGNVLCVLPAELSSKVLDPGYRKYIEQKKLTFISTEMPDAPWTPGRAMARNKYIYLLSNGVLVVASEKKGGTWTGAKECIKNKWVQVYVKPTTKNESGINELKKLGAIEDNKLDLNEIRTSVNYELLTIKEISAYENKTDKAIKTMLTKKGISSLDRPFKTKKASNKKNADIKEQKELF